MRKADILLALVAVILAVWLAITMVRRKTNFDFPFFFFYVECSIIFAILRVSVSSNYLLFFWIYWITEVIYVVLALLALHEVFRKVFAAFYEKRWFWLFFPIVVTTISVMAVIYRFGSPPAQANRVMGLIVSLGMAVNLVQASLFVFFFFLVWLNGIRWREYPFGIVQGFAAIAIGSLGGHWLVSEFGTRFLVLSSYAPSVAYIVAVISWLETFLRPPEPEPKWTLEITPEQLLEEIRQYTKIIERFLGRRK